MSAEYFSLNIIEIVNLLASSAFCIIYSVILFHKFVMDIMMWMSVIISSKLSDHKFSLVFGILVIIKLKMSSFRVVAISSLVVLQNQKILRPYATQVEQPEHQR